MLNLWDPIELEGLTIYRDDVDVRKFYALPDQPVIRADEGGAPEFLFIKYFAVGATAADDVGGGYVQLRANLTIGSERRQRVLDGLRTRLEGEKASGARPFDKPVTLTEPLLASPTWTKGEVKLLTFAAREDGVVTQAAVSPLPDLSSELGASAVIELNPHGAEIFWTAFETGQIPIVLAYDVSYLARVPAGSLVVKARREEVKTKLWARAMPWLWQPRVLRYKKLTLPGGSPTLTPLLLAQLRGVHGPKMVVAALPKPEVKTTLRTTITIESHAGLAAHDELPMDMRDQMMTLATELISESLVGPALFPETAPAGMNESGEDLAVLADEDSSTDSDFTLELSQDGVVERRIAPNGPLNLLVGEENFQNVFVEKDPNGEFFSVLDVLATSEGVDFEADGIALVMLEVRYDQVDDVSGQTVRPPPDQQPQKRLDAEHPEARWRFRLARRAGGGFKREYSYQTKVIYRSSQEDSASPRLLSSDQILNINPRSLMALKVELALTAPETVVESARVDLRYERPDGEVLDATRVLTPGEPRQSWFQVTGALREATAADPQYTYRVTWTLVGVGAVEGPWRESRDQTLVVASPLARTLRFSLQPQGMGEGAVRLAGTLIYEDAARGYEVRRAFDIASGAASVEVAVPVLEDGPDTARVEWRLVMADGTRREGTVERAQTGLVSVGPEVESRLRVEVSPVLLDFDADVKLAVVRLHYVDAENDVEARATLQFKKDAAGSHENPQVWTVDLADKDLSAFDYIVDFVKLDGGRQRVEASGVTDTLLLLERPAVDDGGGN
jgi:hypothetical protein